jgi:ubiquitin C-terminal hydrolase
MSLPVNLPPQEHFQSDGEELLSSVRQLRESLAAIISTPIENYPPDVTDWIDQVLPQVYRRVRSAERASRSLVREVQSLGEQICNLTVHLGLNPKLVHAISSSFDDALRAPAIYPLVVLDPATTKELSAFADPNYLRRGRPQANQSTTGLIQQVLSSGIFAKARQLLEAQELPPLNFVAVLQLFSCIESSISENYVTYILPFLFGASVAFLHDGMADPNAAFVCQFLATFTKMIPDQLDNILTLFCDFAAKGPTVQTRFFAISQLVGVVTDCGIGHSAEAIKSALITATSVQTHHSLLKPIFRFLPRLAEHVQFTDNDLRALLLKSQTVEEERLEAVKRVILTIDRKLDDFAQELITVYPSVYCVLIGKVESLDLSRDLFNRLLTAPDKLLRRSLINVQLNQRLRTHLEEVKDMESISALSYFYLNTPQLDSLLPFLERVIQTAKGKKELAPILAQFSIVLNDINAESIILSLFNVVLNFLVSDPEDERGIALTEVLNQWLDKCDKIPGLKMLDRLSREAFFACPDKLPGIISKILSKTHNLSRVALFLTKVLHDTVPPRHSLWLIRELFAVIHSEKRMLEEPVGRLIQQLQDPGRYANAAVLLTRAVQYDADFYGLNDTVGYIQKTRIMTHDKEFDSFLSFHPFHSTTRLYAHVANRLNIEISSFSLTFGDGTDERAIPPRAALGNIPFQEKGKLQLIVDSSEPNDLVPITPHFIDVLGTRTHLASIFIHLVDDSPESELLFQILCLFRPLTNLGPAHPLQALVTGRCDNPLQFTSSSRIFPFALKAAGDDAFSADPSRGEEVVRLLLNSDFDKVSLMIACSSLRRISKFYQLQPSILQAVLLDSSSRTLREYLTGLIPMNLDKSHYFPLLALATQKEYRSRSRQLFDFVRKLHFPPDLFVPFYIDLKQFEKTHYYDVDETFIGLVSLIPVNDELVSLTLNRLFSAPTACRLGVPFVHTTESWTAALHYLRNELTIRKIRRMIGSLRIVPTSNVKMSNDFTYWGRNGIQNMGSTCYMNALLQILNVLESMSLKLIARPAEGLKPFVQQVRQVLAQLRFTRGQNLSVRTLVETIPNFNVRVQEDAGEFLTMLVNRIHDELDNSAEITHHMKGQWQTQIRIADEQVLSNVEDFFYLSLRTKHMSRLDEAFVAFFEEEYMENGYHGRGPAYRRYVITNWPDYLVIQLERWEFALDTNVRKKLVHEFDFPVTLWTSQIQPGSDTDFEYKLVGVVVHEGSADQGHYVSIVEGADDEWFLCNDQIIEYFDINQLPSWTFGIIDDPNGADEDISTGYLLFYARQDMEKVEPIVPPDLEERLNKENAKSWPQAIFYSPLFVSFVLGLLTEHLKNPMVIELGLIVFFRIVVIQGEEEISLWAKALVQGLATRERCQSFFEFLDDNIGDSLAQIISLSDAVATAFYKLVSHGFGKLLNTTRPLGIVLQHVGQPSPKKQGTAAIYNLIVDACEDLKVEWLSQDEVISLMLDFLTSTFSPDANRQVAKAHIHAFNSLMSILNDIVSVNGVTDSMLQLFELDKLNRIANCIKKSDSFMKLLSQVGSLRPDLFQDISPANQAVKAILLQAIPITTTETDDAIDLELGYLWPNVTMLLFADSAAVRQSCLDIILGLIGKRDLVLVTYLKTSLVQQNLVRPDVPGKNSVHLYLCSLTDSLIYHEEANCWQFVSLLHELSFLSPNVLVFQFGLLMNRFRKMKIRELRMKMLEVIHNLLAFDSDLAKGMPRDDVQVILASDLASPMSVHFLALFREDAERSALSGACVEYYLREEFDEDFSLLLDLLGSGMVPGDFPIPPFARDVSKLKIAIALWNVWETRRRELRQFMASTLSCARPAELFACSEMVKTAQALTERMKEERIA